MPEGEPLLLLPQKDFLTRLRALTNERIVLDVEAEAGWRLELEPPYPTW